MKTPIIFFLCFLFINTGSTQGSIFEFKKQSANYHFLPQPHLSLEQAPSPINRSAIKKSLFYSGLGFIFSGSTFLVLSKNNHQKYKSLKNDVVYSGNNFTQTELEKIDMERISLLDSANRQRSIGNLLLIAGSVSIGVSILINPSKETMDGRGIK